MFLNEEYGFLSMPNMKHKFPGTLLSLSVPREISEAATEVIP